MRYHFERLYPYAVSIIICIIAASLKIVIFNSVKFDEALDAIMTVTSIVIGFLGAILPVVLSMKNESKFVKYVFDCDRNKLFLKYIRETIMCGLGLVMFTLILYFRDLFLFSKHIAGLCYIWIFLVVSFILCTYRSLNSILILIFSSDKKDGAETRYENIDDTLMENYSRLRDKYK